jgi:Ca-activated chloride channel family protein
MVPIALCLLGTAWPPVARASESEPPHSGTLLLKSAPDAVATPALRQSTRMRARVTGNVARVRVTQQFSNPSDD